jgi:hypothetical protein
MTDGRGFPATRHRIASARMESEGIEDMEDIDIWRVWMCKKQETTNPKWSRKPINFFLETRVRYEIYSRHYNDESSNRTYHSRIYLFNSE